MWRTIFYVSGAPYPWRTEATCATVITPIRGAHRRALRIKVICGFICVAHARCITKPKNGTPQIGVLLVMSL
jgi:hypothetical protein